MVRIIIAGGRDFKDYDLLKKSVSNILSNLKNKTNWEEQTVEFISGTAKGADRLGERFASENNYPIKRFPANWALHGKIAGFIRNEQMAKYAAEADDLGILIAFWDGQSRGTENMIALAERYRLEACIIIY